MNIQDRQKTLTAEGLRQRYNLDGLDSDRKSIQLIKNSINKVEIEFQNYMDIVNKSLEEYQDQVEITTWFSNEYPIVDIPENYLGDLYYDRENGKAYKYIYDEDNTEYIWQEIESAKQVETLAIENSKADTADNKRIVFIDTPTTPYTIGDVWIRNGTYYRCRAARESGAYSMNDWIIYTDYTEDMVMLDTRGEIDQLKTDVQTNYVTNTALETNTEGIYATVSSTYATQTTVSTLDDEVQQTKTETRDLDTRLSIEEGQMEAVISDIGDRTGKSTSITADLDQLQSIFQITGGSNLIQNSQFLLEDETWNFVDGELLTYHTPLGQGYSSDLIGVTKANAEIKLRNVEISTKTENINNLVIGQTYTLNYFYKQDDLTTTTIDLINSLTNEIIYTKVLNEEQELITNDEFQFVATNTSYIFKVTTSTTSNDNGYFYLYDLMLNSGDKKSWEPAASEIYSTVLQMSQLGLKVVSTGSKIATLLNTEGLKIYEYNPQTEQIGNIITEFDDDGLSTKTALIEIADIDGYIMKTITISGTRHHIEYFGGE